MNYLSQKGIALFQVLLITTVISILAIQFTQTAKNQISIANTLANRINASLIVKTAESELLFSLLTQNKIKNIESDDAIAAQWNFYGMAFKVGENVEYAIQDQASLIDLFYIENIDKLTAAFKLIGVPEPRTFATNLINKKSFITNSTNLPVQTYQELNYIDGLSPLNWQDIKEFVSIRPQAYINPKLAPKELLPLHLPSQIISTVLERREKGNLSNLAFRQLSGLSIDDTMVFSASNSLRISIKVIVDDVEYNQKMEYIIQPYKKYPLIEYEITN